MKYLVLVSHGTFAPALRDTLSMFAGNGREDILADSLKNGMDVDTFTENFRQLVAHVTEEDEILLVGDIVGGSPLTAATNVLSERGLLGKTKIVGGMNLPLALNAAIMKDSMEMDELVGMIMEEAREGIKEFIFEAEDNEDDI